MPPRIPTHLDIIRGAAARANARNPQPTHPTMSIIVTYNLTGPSAVHTLDMPEGAIVIGAEASQTGVHLHVLQTNDPKARKSRRQFTAVPGGQPLPDRILDCGYILKVGRFFLFEVPLGAASASEEAAA